MAVLCWQVPISRVSMRSSSGLRHCLQATYGLQWPITNPKRLAPRFVPLLEAESGGSLGA